MPDKPFKIVLDQQDYTCKIELEGNLKSELLSQFSKCITNHKNMSTWLDDNTVSTEQREAFLPVFQNLLHTISFLWDLLQKAGVTKAEIREHIDMPF